MEIELFLTLKLFIFFFSDLIVGFVDTTYNVSEGDGNVTVLVEIKQGTVGNGETITLEFTTRSNTATSMSTTEEYLLIFRHTAFFYLLPSFFQVHRIIPPQFKFFPSHLVKEMVPRFPYLSQL